MTTFADARAFATHVDGGIEATLVGLEDNEVLGVLSWSQAKPEAVIDLAGGGVVTMAIDDASLVDASLSLYRAWQASVGTEIAYAGTDCFCSAQCYDAAGNFYWFDVSYDTDSLPAGCSSLSIPDGVCYTGYDECQLQ